MTDPLTLALTGQLPFVAIAAPLLALPLSWFLLRIYRRSVIAAMRSEPKRGLAAPRAEAGATNSSHTRPSTLPGVTTPETRIEMFVVKPAALPRLEDAAGRLEHDLSRRPWHLAAVYGAAGLSFASVMAGAFLLASNTPFLPVRFGMLTWVFAWPAVITTTWVAATNRLSRLGIVAGYTAVGLVLSALALVRNAELTADQIALLFAIMNLPPSVLLFAFWNRRVRAVGPLVLVFLAVAITGSLVVLAVVGGSDVGLRNAVEVGTALGLGAAGTFAGMAIAGFALFSLPGWLLLRWIGRGYRAKQLSDQSLSLGALWLLFALVGSVGLVFEGAAWILSGAAAFATFRVATALGMRLLRSRRGDAPGTRLLVLRVFALGPRSERLFEALARRWRHIGSLQLIAGPDLATTTVEPHEFLSFVSGKLASLFIENERALDDRMKDLDLLPDRDGRFRVNEFFCYDNTWEQVLGRLVHACDAVLMDLRGFSPDNAGCRFELRALAQQVPFDRVTLVIDDETDTALLESELSDALATAAPDSPNRAPGGARLTSFRLASTNPAALAGLLACLCAAAAGANKETP